MKTIVLVACSKSKLDLNPRLDPPVQARDLYTSPLFKKAREYAETVGDSWYILSAKFALVAPSTLLTTYDQTLADMSPRDVRIWGWKTSLGIISATMPGDRIIFLAGRNYIDPIVHPTEYLRRHRREAFERREILTPLEGMGIGERLHWLNTENARRTK